MTLRTDPKLTWLGRPAWDPARWEWVTTLDGKATHAEGTENGCLVSVRSFQENNGRAAIEILVRHDGATYSAIIRLDNAQLVPDLSRKLDSLRGHSLKEISGIQLSHRSPIPHARNYDT